MCDNKYKRKTDEESTIEGKKARMTSNTGGDIARNSTNDDTILVDNNSTITLSYKGITTHDDTPQFNTINTPLKGIITTPPLESTITTPFQGIITTPLEGTTTIPPLEGTMTTPFQCITTLPLKDTITTPPLEGTITTPLKDTITTPPLEGTIITPLKDTITTPLLEGTITTPFQGIITTPLEGKNIIPNGSTIITPTEGKSTDTISKSVVQKSSTIVYQKPIEAAKHVILEDLSKFTLDKVLTLDTRRKKIFLLGSFIDQPGEQAIVTLEKTNFDIDHLSSDFFEGSKLTPLIAGNDIYSSYKCSLPLKYNDTDASIIHQASQSHINKYSPSVHAFIHETPEMYEKYTKQFIQKKSLGIDWVYNILDGTAESERVVLHDSDAKLGFVMLPDMKWDGKNKDTLYYLIIVNARDLTNIRDLRYEHLPLLKNLQAKCYKYIEDKFGYEAKYIRAYFHYQPTFYHLHVHVTFLGYDAPGIVIGKSHLLDDVISNLEVCSELYARKTLSFHLPITHPLYLLYQ